MAGNRRNPDVGAGAGRHRRERHRDPRRGQYRAREPATGRVLFRGVHVRAVDDAPSDRGKPVVRWGVGRVGAPDRFRPVGLHRSCGHVEAPRRGMTPEILQSILADE